MKYKPELYAKAFARAAEGPLSPAAEKKLVENLIATATKNGDRNALPKILAEAEKLLRRKEGVRKVVIASARPLGKEAKAEVKKLLKKGDVVEEAVDPELQAGITVTVDDELQFDGSLRHKLDKLFRTQ
jgi:F0F1-type ATP synthase delta subunit